MSPTSSTQLRRTSLVPPVVGIRALLGLLVPDRAERVEAGVWWFDIGGFTECAIPAVEKNGPSWFFEPPRRKGAH